MRGNVQWELGVWLQKIPPPTLFQSGIQSRATSLAGQQLTNSSVVGHLREFYERYVIRKTYQVHVVRIAISEIEEKSEH